MDFSPYIKYCALRKEGDCHRELPASRPDADWIDFSTNDYLGLSQHPVLLEAASEYGAKHGVGATGARLLSGNHPVCEILERQIALDKQLETALIWNSGYQANSGALLSLCDARVLGRPARLFFDKLNHASLYQAAFASGAALIRYSHLDMEALESRLQDTVSDPAPTFIVSETVFGMDGTIAPLDKLSQLARKFGTGLYLDEAHATGVMGASGYGLSNTVDLEGIAAVVMGTFSKALGGAGAYTASAAVLKNYFINHAPGFIYSTALPPTVLGAALAAWRLLPSLKAQRAQVHRLSAYLREALARNGFHCFGSQTPIVPISVRSSAHALTLKDYLAYHHIRVSAIRPPTVPPNAVRLRLALCAHHTQADIDRFLEVFLHAPA